MSDTKISVTTPYDHNTLRMPSEVASYTIANMRVGVYNKEDIPNTFHRFMQKLILGMNWNIYKEGKDD